MSQQRVAGELDADSHISGRIKSSDHSVHGTVGTQLMAQTASVSREEPFKTNRKRRRIVIVETAGMLKTCLPGMPKVHVLKSLP